MKFWDASAVVPLVVAQSVSDFVADLRDRNPIMFVWWATSVECMSALARLEREGHMSAGDVAATLEVLRTLSEEWQIVLPTRKLRIRAQRLLLVHPLRAADSLQLAAALAASEGEPETVEFVSFDGPLNEAAAREGFRVVSG